jgi:hypothetical protein
MRRAPMSGGTAMLAYKIPLIISAAVVGAYTMPVGTNQMLLVAQAVLGIAVSFALFMVVLHAAERRDGRRDPRVPRGVTARRELRRARHPQPGSPR